jgi:hypothetical protein
LLGIFDFKLMANPVIVAMEMPGDITGQFEIALDRTSLLFGQSDRHGSVSFSWVKG